MNLFSQNKMLIRQMLIAGSDYSEIATAIGMTEKKFIELINSSKSNRQFVNDSEKLKPENIIIKIAEKAKDDWRAGSWLLSREDPKKYSDTGVRLIAEKPDTTNENEFLQTTIVLRDSIIEKHYRHFESGHDWTLSEGGSRCFEKNTLIKTDKGDIKISDLSAGDKVLSFNHSTNKEEYKRVENVFENKGNKKKCYKITFKNGDEIKCTFDHKIYYQGRYIYAKDLVSLFKQLK